MSSSLDKSLDDIIRQRKNQMQPAGRRTARGRAFGQDDFGPGPDHQFVHRQPRHIRLEPYPTPAMPMSVQTLSPAGGGAPSSTRLFISNLDRGVSDTDIMVLFSELGELRRYCVHYDSDGRSLGTAEVVYERHEDAISAIERYNNVNLDGKPLKIELVGPPPPPPMPHGATANLGWPNFYHRSDQEELGANKGNGGGGGGGAGSVRSSGTGRGLDRGKRQGKQQAKSVSAEELDADLERYQFEARQLK